MAFWRSLRINVIELPSNQAATIEPVVSWSNRTQLVSLFPGVDFSKGTLQKMDEFPRPKSTTFLEPGQPWSYVFFSSLSLSPGGDFHEYKWPSFDLQLFHGPPVVSLKTTSIPPHKFTNNAERRFWEALPKSLVECLEQNMAKPSDFWLFFFGLLDAILSVKEYYLLFEFAFS